MSAPKKIALPDGRTRYRVVYDAGRDPETGKRKQITRTYDRKRDADAELARVRHQRDKGTYVPPSRLTVAALIDGYLKSAAFEHEAATVSNYAHALRPARERLGDRAAQSVDRADIEALRDWMLASGRKRGGTPGTGLGPRSVRLTLGRLSAAFNWALDDGKVARNPCARVKLPRLAKPAPKRWSEGEAERFLAVAAAERLSAAWLLALVCGLRRSEICALRWDDVAGGTVSVHAARVVVDGKVVDKDTPKSDAGARTIPIPAEVTAALAALRKRQAAERLAAGECYTARGYVVVDELGAPPNPEWVSDEWERLVRKAGVPRLTIHGARHNANSVAADLGMLPHDRAAYFGHTVAVNEGTYTHPSPAGLGRVAAAMSGAFKIAGG